MNKEEFIALLDKTDKESGKYWLPRFTRTWSNRDDHWTYVRPHVDGFEPSIDLSTKNSVSYEYYNGVDDVEPIIFTYEEFIEKYLK